jgi:hypothetical protein
MSWRDVPMPDRVAQLLRTEGGLPVPHVAAWSSEETDRLERDPYLARLGYYQPAVFCGGGQGIGRAILGEMTPERQRRAMLDRRCQVCDVELGERRRPNPPWRWPLWLADIRIFGTDERGDVGNDIGGQTIVVRRRRVPLVLEPWSCEDCLAYAIQVCPGLISRRTGGTRRRPPLRLLRVRHAEPVIVTSRISGDGPVAGQTAATYAKMAVVDADVVLPERFLEQHAAVTA